MSTIINMLGAPGIGKSTLAYKLAGEMKAAGYSVEYVDEFAKHKVYEDNKKALDCQPFIFGQQLYKLEIVNGTVDYIITDSPILLSIIYNKNHGGSFNNFVFQTFMSFDSMNFFLTGKPPTYQDSGRVHSEEESSVIQYNIKELMDTNGVEYLEIDQFNIQPVDLISLIEKIKQERIDEENFEDNY